MRAAIVAVMLVAACGGGGEGDDGGDDGGDDDGGDPFEPEMGTIAIAEQLGNWSGEAEPGAAATIRFVDGERFPYHREAGREGECRLLRWEPASDCGACEGVCTADGCVAWPVELDAGTLEIDGLNEAVTVVRDDYTGGYFYSPTAADVFAAGAAITARGDGGADVPAFEVTATAPLPLVTAIESPLELPHDTAFELTWTPDDPETRVHLTISSPNAGHGAPFDTIIECASPDDGAITIPGAYALALGVMSGRPCLVGHECPPSTLTRYRAARTTTDAGAVELWLAAERVFYVSHDAPED